MGRISDRARRSLMRAPASARRVSAAVVSGNTRICHMPRGRAPLDVALASLDIGDEHELRAIAATGLTAFPATALDDDARLIVRAIEVRPQGLEISIARRAPVTLSRSRLHG